MVEGQYYFTNQWFLNATYAISKAYGVSRSRSNWIPGTSGINGMEWALNGDIPQTIQQAEATLWYRPIQAIKFGLQYSYACATYFQYLNPQNNATLPINFPWLLLITLTEPFRRRSPGGVRRVLLLLTSKSVDFKQPTGYYPCGLFLVLEGFS